MFGGKIHSGKNFAAKKLIDIYESHGVKAETMMLAQGVKDGCKDDYSQLASYLNSLSLKAKENGDDELAAELSINEDNWYENKTNITRILLQTYGTEIFRNRVDENWWTDRLAERIKNSDAEVIIVTDFRFPNEYNRLTELVGDDNDIKTIHVFREADNDAAVTGHSSENALDDFKFDYEIDNNGSESDLNEKLNWLYFFHWNWIERGRQILSDNFFDGSWSRCENWGKTRYSKTENGYSIEWNFRIAPNKVIGECRVNKNKNDPYHYQISTVKPESIQDLKSSIFNLFQTISPEI